MDGWLDGRVRMEDGCMELDGRDAYDWHMLHMLGILPHPDQLRKSIGSGIGGDLLGGSMSSFFLAAGCWWAGNQDFWDWGLFVLWLATTIFHLPGADQAHSL